MRSTGQSFFVTTVDLLAEVKRAGASYLLIDEAYPDEKTLLAAIRQA